MSKQAQHERQYPDSIKTDSGWIRLSDLSSNDVVVIQGREILGSQIPLSIYSLDCGHTGKGIAVEVGNVFFCEPCRDNKAVAAVR